MSSIVGQEAIIVDHPRKHDFVTVDPGGENDNWVGVVNREVRQDGTIHSYVIQPWDHNGPMTTQVTAPADAVSIHPNGRLTVLDDISEKRFNNR
jgi:hypothetical protein